MTSLAIKQFFSRAWLWVKQNWEIVLAVIVTAAIVLFLSKGRKVDFGEVLQNLREKHKEEADAIAESQAAEREQVEKVRKQTEEAIKAVEEKYAEASEALDRKKKNEIRKAVEANADDPDAITKRIAELTGFTVVVRDDA